MTHTKMNSPTDYDGLFAQLTPPTAPTIQPEPDISRFPSFTAHGVAMDNWVEHTVQSKKKYFEDLDKFNTSKEKILTRFYNDLEKVYGFSVKLGDILWPVLDKLISDDYKRFGSLNETFVYVAKYAELISACYQKFDKSIKVQTVAVHPYAAPDDWGTNIGVNTMCDILDLAQHLTRDRQ